MPVVLAFVAIAVATASAAVAQLTPSALTDLYGMIFKFVAGWACGGTILWFVAFIVCGRILGLEVGPLKVLLINLLHAVIAFLPAVIAIFLLGDLLGETGLGFAIQVLSLASFVVATKIVLKADFARAALTVLMASAVMSGVMAAATVGLF